MANEDGSEAVIQVEVLLRVRAGSQDWSLKANGGAETHLLVQSFERLDPVLFQNPVREDALVIADNGCVVEGHLVSSMPIKQVKHRLGIQVVLKILDNQPTV